MGLFLTIVWSLSWLVVCYFLEKKVAWLYKEKSFGWHFLKLMVLCAVYNMGGSILIALLFGSHGRVAGAI